jgi:hypothetical protein
MIREAFENHRSSVMVEFAGRVYKTLSDDRDGDRHQRFIVRLNGGHTVLVAHNIDLVERVPLSKGDAVKIRGEYEWNELGGVIHWTHRDTSPGNGTGQAGWIEHLGRRYE